MGNAEAVTESGAIGARLTRARERLGWSQNQAAEKLHLDARAVAALESEQFAALGATVYVRGHLRRYAELLGESSADIEALYNVRRGTQPAPDMLRSFTVTEKQLRQPSRFTPRAVSLFAAALILTALLVWALRRTTAPAPTAAPEASVANTDQSAVSQPGTGPAPSAPAAKAGQPQPPAASTAAAAAGTAANPPVVARQRRTRLTLHFSDATTVTVTDALGRQLLSGEVVAGSGRTLRGRAPFVIRIANAAAVGLVMDDRPVLLTAAMRDTPDLQLQVADDGQASELR